MSIVIVEGVDGSGVGNVANKIKLCTGYSIYEYTQEPMSAYLDMEAMFAKRDRFWSLVLDSGLHDIILPRFFMGMATQGIVCGDWPWSTVRRAESLSKALSDVGAILVLCKPNLSLKTAEKLSEDAEVMRRVRESIHDLMYYNWQGEKYVVHNYGTTQHMLKKLEAKSRKE